MSKPGNGRKDENRQLEDNGDDELELTPEQVKELAVASLSQLDPEDQIETVQTVMGEPATVFAQSMTFQGPLPPAQLLAEYEEIVPGSADRIITLAEREQRNRHSSATKFLHNDRVRISGATFVAFSLIVASVVTAYLGHPIVAGLFGVSAILSGIVKAVIEWVLPKGRDHNN
jgi:uncharacterized membrane protein